MGPCEPAWNLFRMEGGVIMHNWTLLNKKIAKSHWSHYVYINEAGTIALADHSIRNLADPGSTDDGLLTWTGAYLSVFNRRGNPMIMVPVYMKDGRTSTVPTCFTTVIVMAQALGKDVQALIPSLSIQEEVDA